VVEAKKKTKDRLLSIGEVADRAGVATSALRFYESNGLIVSERNDSGHRRYRADALRRVSFIRVAQRIGLTLGRSATRSQHFLTAGHRPAATGPASPRAGSHCSTNESSCFDRCRTNSTDASDAGA